MKKPGCARAWQAEAIEDGRLSDADARSFERHAASCAICHRERHALADLQRAAARLPVLTRTPLERRRLRNELLRRANQLAVSLPSRARQPVLVAAFGLVAVAVVLVLWLRSPAPTQAPDGQPVAGIPTFHISTSPGAEWHTLERGRTLRLSVSTGRFELAVDSLRPGQRFLLALPDGELEVQGTRFIVDVDGKQTRSVHVLEGRVALRLQNRPPRSLSATEYWPAESAAVSAPSTLRGVGDPAQKAAAAGPTATPAPSSAGDPASPPAPGRIAATPAPNSTGEPANEPAPARIGTTPAQERRPESVRQPSAKPGDSPDAAPTQPPSTAGRAFGRAMAAFSAGNYGRAEQLFIDFARDHPADSRVEDATFLRAVARSRRGDASGARVIAREYLRRYPNGLRRRDAERLVR